MHSFEEQNHALYQHVKVQLLLVRLAGMLRITDNLLFMCRFPLKERAALVLEATALAGAGGLAPLPVPVLPPAFVPRCLPRPLDLPVPRAVD